MAYSDVEHGCPQHVASVVGGEVEARLHLATGEGWGGRGLEGRRTGGRANRKELQRRKENDGDEEECAGLNLRTVCMSLSLW